MTDERMEVQRLGVGYDPIEVKDDRSNHPRYLIAARPISSDIRDHLHARAAPHEPQSARQESHPAECEEESDPRGMALQFAELNEQQQDQPVDAGEHPRVERLVEVPLRSRQAPRA